MRICKRNSPASWHVFGRSSSDQTPPIWLCFQRRKMSYWQPPLSNCSQVECKSSIDSVIYNSSNCSNGPTHEECSPFCSGFPQLVPTIFLAFSCLSAFCCIWVFVTYLIFPRLSGYSSKVFLYRSGLTVRLEYVILLAEMCITAYLCFEVKL